MQAHPVRMGECSESQSAKNKVQTERCKNSNKITPYQLNGMQFIGKYFAKGINQRNQKHCGNHE
jgi:hypothetical protein